MRSQETSLTGINDVNNLGGDLFSFALSYNDVKDDIYNQVKPLYNGNISETYWKTANDNYLRGYGYKYDALNRLNDAWYEEPNNPGYLSTNNRILKYPSNFATRNVEYDKNGNITYLRRFEKDVSGATTGVLMDQLFYTYQSNSNKLTAVAQGSGTTQGGFTDGNTVGDDYVYDANGNMTVDKNKGITDIQYNYLNLPTKVSFGATKNITYIYDALGIKLEKVVNDNGAVTTTDYAGGFIYENNQLQFFSQPEGFVEANGNSFNYVYQYKDHLGNIRLNYWKNPISGALEIKEENNYYPFGLKHKGYNSNIIKEHKYKYNGKEFEEGLGLNLYEMDVRSYDPALARWTSIDPVTHHSMSPYNAFDNNPVFWADPSGADGQISNSCSGCLKRGVSTGFLVGDYSSVSTAPITEEVTTITSSVNKDNLTIITQTTTTITGVKSNNGDIKGAYTKATITYTVDAYGEVIKGRTVTIKSGKFTKNANSKVITTDEITSTREINSSDNISTLEKWTNTVSNFNKNNDFTTYNQHLIDTGSSLITYSAEAGLSVFSFYAIDAYIEEKLSKPLRRIISLSGSTISGEGAAGAAGYYFHNQIGIYNKYYVIYDIKITNNGRLIKDFKDSNTRRKEVLPSYAKYILNLVKNIFN